MIQNILALLEKLGTTGTGVVCIIGGLVILLPYFGIPLFVAQGFAWIGVGLTIIVSGRIYAKREAEKSVHDPNLPTASSVPVIQSEITKMVRESNGVTIPTANGVKII